MVDAPLVNRCMQPGSFARNRLYSNLHADPPPSPRIPVRRLPAGCCIDWSTYTYLRHKMFRHKGMKAETLCDTRARQRVSSRSARRALSRSVINLHLVKRTFRKSFTRKRRVYWRRAGRGRQRSLSLSLFTDQRTVSDAARSPLISRE